MNQLKLFLLFSLLFVACNETDNTRTLQPQSNEVMSTTAITTVATVTREGSATRVATSGLTPTSVNDDAGTTSPTPSALVPGTPSETSTPPATGTTVEDADANGRTEEGAYARGRIDAPVTIIDYSDFL